MLDSNNCYKQLNTTNTTKLKLKHFSLCSTSVLVTIPIHRDYSFRCFLMEQHLNVVQH